MEHSTWVTKKLVPKMLNDFTKVIIDWKQDRNADTGLYRLIYESSFIKIQNQIGNKHDLIIEGK